MSNQPAPPAIQNRTFFTRKKPLVLGFSQYPRDFRLYVLPLSSWSEYQRLYNLIDKHPSEPKCVIQWINDAIDEIYVRTGLVTSFGEAVDKPAEERYPEGSFIMLALNTIDHESTREQRVQVAKLLDFTENDIIEAYPVG